MQRTAIHAARRQRATSSVERKSDRSPRQPTSDFGLLGLQRAIGNQAVQRLVTQSADPRHKIQRYTLPSGGRSSIQEEPRLSASTHSFKVAEHKLYLTSELLNTANAALANVGGGAPGPGAFLRLMQTANQRPRVENPDLVQVAPVVARRNTGLSRADSPRQDFLAQRGIEYVSPADCHVAAQTVMGSDDLPIGAFNTEQAVVGDGGGGDRRIAAGNRANAHVANRTKHDFFEYAMPAFANALRADAARAAIVGRIDAAAGTPRAYGEDNTFAAIYREAILPDAALRRQFSERFKINEFAEARVGRGFANVNDERQKAGGERQGRDVWNFHWAGVVVTDGTDYVTLENLSTENLNDINGNWYFQMYGERDQSFHAESLQDSHATTAAMTFGFEATAQPNRPAGPVFNPSPGQKLVYGRVVGNPNIAWNDLLTFNHPGIRPGAQPLPDFVRTQVVGICARLLQMPASQVTEAMWPQIRQALLDNEQPAYWTDPNAAAAAAGPRAGGGPPPPPPRRI